VAARIIPRDFEHRRKSGMYHMGNAPGMAKQRRDRRYPGELPHAEPFVRWCGGKRAVSVRRQKEWQFSGPDLR
jgi:hypothetical protein